MPAKPIILVVAQDPKVRAVVTRDVRRHVGETYTVARADNAPDALARLQSYAKRKQALAMIIAGQTMDGMTGVELLREAAKLFCDSKGFLFTSREHEQAVLRGMDDGTVDAYQVASNDPPEEYFFPMLDDLLDTWQGATCSPFGGICVIGHRWSAASHALKDFLARNQEPYRWLDVENKDANAEVRGLLKNAKADGTKLPVVVFKDGTSLVEPTTGQIADKIGLHTRPCAEFYDLIIVGGGPAGLTAAVYGASEGLSTLMIEREGPGGQAGTSSRIENYLGFPAGLTGADLARRAVEQAKRFGVEILSPAEVVKVTVNGTYRVVTLADGRELSCHALLITTGVKWRKLDAPGVERLTGSGVYYGAAMTEAVACKDGDVFVVGGANSAGQAAMHFSKFAACVTILVRADNLDKSMSHYLIDEISRRPNIRVRTCCEVAEALGKDKLDAVVLRDKNTGALDTMRAAALFLCIGAEPETEWLGDLVQRDAHGFIEAGAAVVCDKEKRKAWPLDRDPYFFETRTPGIFVAGDVWTGPAKRVAAAVGQGAVAVQFIHQYLATVR